MTSLLKSVMIFMKNTGVEENCRLLIIEENSRFYILTPETLLWQQVSDLSSFRLDNINSTRN